MSANVLANFEKKFQKVNFVVILYHQKEWYSVVLIMNWRVSVDGTSDVLVDLTSRCGASLSRAAMNQVSLWCYLSGWFLRLLCKRWPGSLEFSLLTCPYKAEPSLCFFSPGGGDAWGPRQVLSDVDSQEMKKSLDPFVKIISNNPLFDGLNGLCGDLYPKLDTTGW